MTESKRLSPLYFFLSLGMLIALITSVSAFLQLVFQTLDQLFPDVLTSSYQYGYPSYSFEGIRNSLALVIIVAPIFLVLSRFWLAAAQKHLSQWDEVLHRWTIYIVLFLASVTIIADLVTLVRYFVSGEITIRFLLKVAVTFVVAGLAGWYYIRQLQRAHTHVDRQAKWFAVAAGVLGFAAVVAGFCVIGAPGSQRQLRLDQRRIDDLQSIQWQLISYWQQKTALPETLAELSNPISSYMVPRDPEFQKGKEYEYRKFRDTKFELCATFAKPLPEGWISTRGIGMGGDGFFGRDMAVSMPAYPGGNANNSWDHDRGRTCFQREIDPDLYPPNPKPLG